MRASGRVRLRLGGRRPRRAPNRAFTLVELLVALALTALLAVVSGRIAAATLHIRDTVIRGVDHAERDARIVDRLADDVANLLILDSQPTVSLFGTPRPVLQLSVLTAASTAGSTLHVPRVPAAVHYRWVRDRESERVGDIVREVRNRTHPGAPPLRETLATQVAELKFEVWRQREWVTQYPSTKNDAPARAVRVAVTWADTKRSVSHTFLLSDGSVRP